MSLILGLERGIRILVRDDGRGLTPEQLETIWEPFAQLGRTGEGLGIGLTLCRQFIELHGGSISAHSEGPGRGSSFVVQLPETSCSDSPCPAQKSDEEPASLAGRRVLVVEDDLAAARALEILLSRRGCVVQVTTNGEQALEVASRFHPEIVLLDLDLAGRSGFEVATDLRRAGESKTAILALTGFNDPATTRRAKKAGFDEVLTKPLSFDRLGEWVEHGPSRERGRNLTPDRSDAGNVLRGRWDCLS